MYPPVTTYRKQFERELFDHVIPFWERHSPDPDHGGYFNCLDRDGKVYETRKHIWLQGRQAWMFSTLYRTVDQRQEWLDMAASGIRFLREHAVRDDGRVFFSVSADGKPVYMQRKIFSECFYTMALAGFAHATGEMRYLNEAREMLARIWDWSKDLSKVGRPRYEGEVPAQSLAVPMILLNLIEEVTPGGNGDESGYSAEIDECIRRMLMHVHPGRQLVFETVRPDGSLDDNHGGGSTGHPEDNPMDNPGGGFKGHPEDNPTNNPGGGFKENPDSRLIQNPDSRLIQNPDSRLIQNPEGRLLNPGHAIEAGWFLQHWAQRRGDADLAEKAADMVRWSFRKGWDSEHGGIYYFLDSAGYSPTQLEWPMKLWWPHCEAMYAHILNYKLFGQMADWQAFAQTTDYSFAHFPDHTHGEWYGYLDRQGAVTHRFKGGPYKGCFHVPRALLMCWNTLKELEQLD